MKQNNLNHRSGAQRWDGTYNLRRAGRSPPLHRIAKPIQQKNKDQYLKRIRKTWPITRANKASRGIQREGQQCFRISAIQALLHLPKFMNWILSHNENGKFECHFLIWTQDHPFRLFQGKCAACMFKDLIQKYWGDKNIGPDGKPRPLKWQCDEMLAIERLDDQLAFNGNPLDDDDYDPSKLENRGREIPQDTEECQTRLLRACLESVNYLDADNIAWKEQFDALFMIDVDMKWQCSKCHKERDVPSDANESKNGFTSIATEASGTDSVPLALRRYRYSIIEGLHCDKCQEDPGEIHETLYITGAPEILRLRLNTVKQVMVYDKKQKKKVPVTIKHHKKVRIPETLSLASFLRRNEPNMLALNGSEQGPQYTLSSVISHLGEDMNHGHWAVTVRDPDKDYGINDDYCYELDATTDSLNDNPQQIDESAEGGFDEFQAVVIAYVRQHTPKAHRSKKGQKGASSTGEISSSSPAEKPTEAEKSSPPRRRKPRAD